MTDDPRSTAVDVLARQFISNCLRDSLHHYMTVRRLPKADIDAIRARAREVEEELRPTVEAFESAYDAIVHGGA